MFYLGGYGNPATQGFPRPNGSSGRAVLKRDKQGRAPTHVIFILPPQHYSSLITSHKPHLSPL